MTKNYQIIQSYDDFYPKLIELFESAQSEIFMASWLVDFECEIRPGLFFSDLLQQTSDRGIKINLLVFENPIEDWNSPALLPINCCLKLAKPFGKHIRFPANLYCSWIWRDKNLPLKQPINGMHQKYIAVDGKTVLLGQTDLNHERRGNFRNRAGNSRGFIWHEFGLVLPCSSDFWRFCKDNFRLAGHANRPGKPFVGSFENEFEELPKYLDLIDRAERYILIENQIFFCTDICQHAIGKSILKRLHRAHQEKKTFYVLIVTNDGQPDLDCGSHDDYIRLFKRQTQYYLECLILDNHIPETWINQHFRICHLGNHDPTYFLHSKIIIADGTSGFLSSTNLSDRSLRRGFRDRELGTCLDGFPGLASDLENLMLTAYAHHGEPPAKNIPDLMESWKEKKGLLNQDMQFSLKDMPSKKIKMAVFGNAIKALNHGIFW